MTAQTSTAHDDHATKKTQRRYDRQAAVYDLMELPTELLVFGKLRRKLWTEVTGKTVLEVGVGTGKNLAYHPESTRTVAVDLSPRMLHRAVVRARRRGRKVDFVLADAQHMPFHERAFDAAVATFVFCSVPDPVAGLEEMRRIVRDKGRVHLLEHVRAGNPVIGRLMDLLNPIAVRLTGANINRDTVANVRKAGVALEGVESRAFGIVKWIRGARSEGTAMQERTAITGEAPSSSARQQAQ
ncbi:MAG: methyltransferase domain-containing protein [Chloroflexi bacterium]|nr:methyltransferase domain-containing protein [Chloroflexota bacterium]